MPLRDLMTEETAREILSSLRDRRDAQLFINKTNTPFVTQKLVIPLSTARNEADPYSIRIPFRSFWIQDATDVNVTINIRLLTRDSYSGSFTVRKNDAYSHDDMCTEIHLDWAAQAAKTITVILFTQGEFRSGSQLSITGGGVYTSEGTSFTDGPVTIAAAAATIVFAQDSTRVLGKLQNILGTSIWVGDSAVTNAGASIGEEIPAGGSFEWKNTAALYAYNVAGGDIFRRIQS